MKLVPTEIKPRMVFNGNSTLDMTENETLSAEADKVSILKEKVPKGKKWHVILNVSIDETDA